MAVRLVAGLLVAAGSLAALWFGALSFRPANLILITVDTMRADRLSSYGYTESSTPNMDRLAEEGVLFPEAYCDMPWTTGSLASTMTGTFGPKHGLQSFQARLPDDKTTIAELLRARGYTTGAVVASFAVDSAYNLGQGFQSYDDELSIPLFRVPGQKVEQIELSTDGDSVSAEEAAQMLSNNAYRSDASVTEAANAWLSARHHEQPFFLWVHYFGPHERLVVEPGVKLYDKVIDDYDPDTREADAAIGELLDRIDDLGLTEDTMVILHSDHGQAFREHGVFGHGHDLHEESMRIPMLMRYPRGIEKGRSANVIARNVDILPTALDYLGVDPGSGLDGRSLKPAIAGQEMPIAPAYMELIGTPGLPIEMPPLGPMFASSTTWSGLRRGPWKYMTVKLAPPCVRDPQKFEWGWFGVNPRKVLDGTPIPDEQCSQIMREDVYRADGPGYIREGVVSNLIAKEKAVATAMAGEIAAIVEKQIPSEVLELDQEQTDKLKSLGYLQ